MLRPQAVCRQQERVNEFKRELEALEGQISRCESNLASLRKQQAEVSSQIDELNVQVQNLGREIQYLEQQKSLASRNNNAEAVNRCTQRIFETNRLIVSVRSERNCQKELLGSLQSEESDLRRNLRTLEDRKEKTSVSLKRSQQKYEQMKSAGDAVVFQMERFLDSVATFQTKAICANTSNLSGIDCCLSAIDEYIGTNL